MVKYSKEIELLMQSYYGNLNEKQKRIYAALESMKLGWGGQSYISNLLGLSRTTLHLAKKHFIQIRRGFQLG